MVSLKRRKVHVDRRVVGWSAGRHVDHPCGGQISPWPARKVTEKSAGTSAVACAANESGTASSTPPGTYAIKIRAVTDN